MVVLNPVPEVSPDPDCPRCGGEGVPQSGVHHLLADEWSNKACRECWMHEEEEEDP